MSKLIHADTHDLRLPAFVQRHDDSDTLAEALRVAGEGAVALAQGSSAAGLFAARKGLDAAGGIFAATRRAAAERRAGKAAAARPDRTGGRTGLVVAVALATVAAGGVVLYRRRRPAHPPIAPEPPRVRPVDSPAAAAEDVSKTASPKPTDTSGD
ncbi:hypothetical protein [Rhodococcus sp. CH91]|uniref:hypothetical protein n=1 Tax=Rhodococcus sp. CH91 TaxID=2910256 RepID=UPI001F4B9606|nr:hypothetical protein [Rhodococcus sp. CH91]